MLHALALAGAVSPLKLSDLAYYRRTKLCRAAVTLSALVRCNAKNDQNTDWLARDIVNQDLRGLHVINGACGAPWHVVLKAAGESGTIDYGGAELTGTEPDAIALIPLDAGNRRYLLHYRLHGLEATYIGYSARR
jgi:hypothetical protein